MKNIHDAEGTRYIPKTYLIEIGAISAFHKSIIINDKINEQNHVLDTQKSHIVTPPTFSRLLKPGKFENEIENPYTDRLDGSSEWHYFTQITPGDIITVFGKISDVKIRNGSLGDMCIVTSKFNYVNQRKETTCTQINTIIYYKFSITKQIKMSSKSTALPPNPLLHSTITNLSSLNIGDIIPSLIKQPSTQQLVMYAGASRDFYQVHYDQAFAKTIGLPKVIVHGALKSAFLGQMITNFIDQSADLTRLFVRYNKIDFEGYAITCKGAIKNISTAIDSKKIVDCNIWIENTEGKKTTQGTATFKIN